MAIKRGRGMASVNYPTGMNLGGDPSQALVHANPGGKFMVSLSSIDLGQGMKTIARQIAATKSLCMFTTLKEMSRLRMN